MDLSLSGQSWVGRGAASCRPRRSWPLGRRSGRVPALSLSSLNKGFSEGMIFVAGTTPRNVAYPPWVCPESCSVTGTSYGPEGVGLVRQQDNTHPGRDAPEHFLRLVRPTAQVADPRDSDSAHPRPGVTQHGDALSHECSLHRGGVVVAHHGENALARVETGNLRGGLLDRITGPGDVIASGEDPVGRLTAHRLRHSLTQPEGTRPVLVGV